jgi:hypothetical protein
MFIKAIYSKELYCYIILSGTLGRLIIRQIQVKW